jgi:hypothetical protein
MNRFAFVLAVLPAAFVACSSTNSGTTTAADAGDPDASVAPDATTGGTQCSAARQQALLPINKVSTGAVSVVSESGAQRTLYVDASAGGTGGASKSPRVYVNLETATRVDIDDTTAFTNTEWDLALKRSVIYTNSGDMGVGQGGGAELTKSFASVTAADADAVQPEKLFDDECVEQKDQIGGPLTTFSNWYDYDQSTNVPTPKDLTYLVRGATGKLYKIQILTFAGLPDGGTGTTTGIYLLKVESL